MLGGVLVIRPRVVSECDDEEVNKAAVDVVWLHPITPQHAAHHLPCLLNPKNRFRH